VPEIKSDWVRNPIDAFVLEKLQARGWKPASAAEPRALLRRMYMDLNGLPPSLAEQDAFLKDPARLEALVDELLSRPAYGERWGRHWLDLVRYAETNGYERDATKPNAWRYRDYVIRAFNDDKPFDRFILEQLAGDELPDASAETFIALGYYRLGPWDDEPADPKEDRFDQLDDIVSTTSQVFLGMTLGCARCHNHKFEPLTARDYYSMVAIFNGLERPQKGRREMDLPIGTPPQIDAVRAIDREIEALSTENDDVSEAERVERIGALRKAAPNLPRGVLHGRAWPKAATRVPADPRQGCDAGAGNDARGPRGAGAGSAEVSRPAAHQPAPAHLGAVAGEPRQSADGARDGESRVAASFRRGNRAHAQRLRRYG